MNPGLSAGIKSTIFTLCPDLSAAAAISFACGLSKSNEDLTIPLAFLTTPIKPKAPPVHNISSLLALSPLRNILSTKGSFLSSLSVNSAKSFEVAPTKSAPKLDISNAALPPNAPPIAPKDALASTANAGLGPNFCTFLKKSTVLSNIPIVLPNNLTGAPTGPGTFFNFLANSLILDNLLS